jgi:hypothetical protein
MIPQLQTLKTGWHNFCCYNSNKNVTFSLISIHTKMLMHIWAVQKALNPKNWMTQFLLWFNQLCLSWWILKKQMYTTVVFSQLIHKRVQNPGSSKELGNGKFYTNNKFNMLHHHLYFMSSKSSILWSKNVTSLMPICCMPKKPTWRYIHVQKAVNLQCS